jgi:hypothetical protein
MNTSMQHPGIHQQHESNGIKPTVQFRNILNQMSLSVRLEKKRLIRVSFSITGEVIAKQHQIIQHQKCVAFDVRDQAT